MTPLDEVEAQGTSRRSSSYGAARRGSFQTFEIKNMKTKFIKSIFLICFVGTLTGCSTLNRVLTDGGRRDPLSTQKIAVVSTLGDTFSVFCIGTTIFNGRDFDQDLGANSLGSHFASKTCAMLTAMGHDASVEQELRSYAKTKRSMVAVGGERDVVDSLLSELSRKGYTALLLISDWRTDYYDGGRQVTGAQEEIGLISSSMFSMMRRSYLYASIEMHLYDIRDSKNFRVVRESEVETIDLKGDWPKSFTEIPLRNRAVYLEKTKRLVDSKLGSMLKEVLSKI